MQWGMYHGKEVFRMRKLTVFEWIVLILTSFFAFFCIVWLGNQHILSPGWQVRTERSAPSMTQPPDSNPYPDGLLENEIINLNTATRSDLLRLPNIGATRADAIISYREEHGPFQTVDDLLNVFGIGPTTLEQLRAYICTG